MTIQRATNSQVPLQADSALVRVWNPVTGTNQVKAIAIPDPSSTTTVSFSLPAGSGYSVGVVAFHGSSGGFSFDQEALAVGRSDNVTVPAGGTTEAQVQVAPWAVQFTAPDTLTSGQQVTVRLTFSQLPNDFSYGWDLSARVTPWTSDADHPFQVVNGSFVGATATATFNVPTVTADTSIWFQFRFSTDSRSSAWQSPLPFFAPSLMLGDTLFRRPVKVPGGTVIVTFSHHR